MEKSALIQDNGFPETRRLLSRGYQRIHFGTETCEHLLPSPERLLEVLRRSAETPLAVTLLTPPVGEKRFERLEKLFETLSRVSVPSPEIEINDWGVLHRVSNGGFPVKPVLGRLLNKQIRDRRYFLALRNQSPRIGEGWAENEYLLDFLESRSIRRISFDNVPGFPRGVSPGFRKRFRGNLYFPDVLLSTGRRCLIRLRAGENDFSSECPRPCRTASIKIRKFEDMPLHLRGNALYYANPRLSDDLEQWGIDRIVEPIREERGS
jgi:hypothetical protein